jgi:hypothetical protein
LGKAKNGKMVKWKRIDRSINDSDKNGLMATIYQLDRSKGLDLFLQTRAAQG